VHVFIKKISFLSLSKFVVGRSVAEKESGRATD